MSKRGKPKPKPKPRPTRPPGYIEKVSNVEKLARIAAAFPQRVNMHFYSVDEGVPPEGARVLVRIRDGSFIPGAMQDGHFAEHVRHSEEYLLFAHPEWITHWMEIIDPVPRGRLPDLDEEAAFQSQGEAPDRGEDVHA